MPLLALCLVFLFSSAALQAETGIQASPKLPATSPWKLESLSKAPAFEWVDKQSPVRSLLYTGEPYGGKPTRVFAYYATPGTLAGDASLDKNLPAVVLVHGGGGTAFREWAELWAKRGYAAIAMDLAGSRPIEGTNAHDRRNRERLADGGPDQGDDEKFGSVDKPAEEQWPYHAVANVLLAHSLIRSFDEVDENRTAVTGISWGGYLTCIVAGVDSRFKAAVPVYGCGFLHENSVWLDRFQKMTPQQRDRWVELWDPSRYLPAVSMPILFVNGTNDFAYPLDSYTKSFDAVEGEKNIRVTVNMPHGHQAGWNPPEIGLFIDQYLKDGQPLAKLGKPSIENDEVKCAIKSESPIKAAAIHWTTDEGPINRRTWQMAEAKIDGETISAKAPPEKATAWFLTATDERGAIVSSRVELHQP
jgi:dienelactone hydrolase